MTDRKPKTPAKVCPICEVGVPRCKDSRPVLALDQQSVRRRYQCDGCGARYTTVEVRLEVARALGTALDDIRKALGYLPGRDDEEAA